MPYPPIDHPDYCAGSRQPVPGADPDALWWRCPACDRLIAPMGNTGLLFPHKRVPGRRNDAVQEGLHAAGCNRREVLRPWEYADG